MEKYFKILGICPLFASVGVENYDKMLRCFGARVVKFRKNTPVFAEGEPANWVGIVLTGSVQMIREDYVGNRSILSMAVPGQLFGEGFACAGVDSLPISFVTASDSEIMLIACKHVLTLCHNVCQHHHQMIQNLLHSVAQSNLRLSEKIEILSKRTTREKLMTYLMSEARVHDSSEFTIPYDRQELADYLGVERSALSTVIGKLREEGIIQVDRAHFRLCVREFDTNS